MKISHLAISAAFFLVVTACSKPDKEVTLDSAVSKTTATQSLQEKQSQSVQHGDKATPLESYQELKSGKQLMFAYLAIAAEPVDYEKIGLLVSERLRSEGDEFKKKDLLTSLKPQIDASIDKAKQGKYYMMEIGEARDVEKYDFESKSFTVSNLPQGNGYRYFYDASSYKLTFSNTSAFNKLIVKDEVMARQIEGLRSKYADLKITVYFFANDTEIGSPIIKAEIMKIRLTDARGNVLAQG